MKILFTGGSSFTGYWFIKELARSGHDVYATLQKPVDEYFGVRHKRVQRLSKFARLLDRTSFGDQRFLDILQTTKFDALCHHAAFVQDYKSNSFDVIGALENNTRSIAKIIERLKNQGCKKIIITGSVFEHDEGIGNQPLEAFSPYGLSKALTADVFRYWSKFFETNLIKFVIPNPFGPFEDERFTTYMVRNWLIEKSAVVKTPNYIRDNIHVSLLAIQYKLLLESISSVSGYRKFGPTGYVSTQGEFAKLFSREMRPRLNLECKVELKEQTEFYEPIMRVNSDILDFNTFDWSETRAWDDLAEYYLEQFTSGGMR